MKKVFADPVANPHQSMIEERLKHYVKPVRIEKEIRAAGSRVFRPYFEANEMLPTISYCS